MRLFDQNFDSWSVKDCAVIEKKKKKKKNSLCKGTTVHGLGSLGPLITTFRHQGTVSNAKEQPNGRNVIRGPANLQFANDLY